MEVAGDFVWGLQYFNMSTRLKADQKSKVGKRKQDSEEMSDVEFGAKKRRVPQNYDNSVVGGNVRPSQMGTFNTVLKFGDPFLIIDFRHIFSTYLAQAQVLRD